MDDVYIIFNMSEIDTVDFNQVLETDRDTIRLNNSGTKSFVRWNSIDPPLFVDLLITKEGPYSYNEILEILNAEEWTPIMISNK